MKEPVGYLGSNPTPAAVSMFTKAAPDQTFCNFSDWKSVDRGFLCCTETLIAGLWGCEITKSKFGRAEASLVFRLTFLLAAATTAYINSSSSGSWQQLGTIAVVGYQNAIWSINKLLLVVRSVPHSKLPPPDRPFHNLGASKSVQRSKAR